MIDLSGQVSPLSPDTVAWINKLGISARQGAETSSQKTSTSRPELATSKQHKRTRRGTRGGRNKRRQISVVHINSSHAHTMIRSHQRGVNSSNLTFIPIAPSTRKPECLLITVFNAQSLGNSCKRKRSAINDFILSNHIDILCVTETWFRETGDEPKLRDLAPAGYTTMSYPRPTTTCGGGIAFVVSDKLLPHCSFVSSFPFEHLTFELVHLKLVLPSSPVTNIFGIYRPVPSKKNKLTPSMFINELPDFLEFLNDLPGTVLLIGDFNFHFNKPTVGYTPEVLEILDTFGLKQSVQETTNKQGNIVDWVVYRDSDHILKSSTVDNNLASDHYAITCELAISRPSIPKIYKEVRKISAIDIEAFKADLTTAIPSEPSAHQLTSALRATLDKHAPMSRRLISDRSQCQWYNTVGPELSEAKQERRRAERRWRATGLTVHREIFQSTRNRVTEIVHQAKTLFYSSQILVCNTAKQLFNITNSLLGKVCVSPLPSTFQAEELPQKFLEFFNGKIDTIRGKLDSSVHGHSFIDKVYKGPALACFHPVSEDYVKKLCLRCSPKSCELDAIPTHLLFQCIDVILPHLTHVINTSLSSGHVPEIFKSAVVRPLIKKPSLDKNVLKNYRPVSNLSFLSKLLEKIILNQVLEHLEKNHLLNPHQSAYRQGHSCETALLRIVNDLLSGLDDGNISMLAMLDLSAAFDTIDHDILFSRLQNSFGFKDTALNWIISYLTERTQTVCVQDRYSDSSLLRYGVPQGSVLGPVLFVLYASPVSDVISRHAMSHESFADDTQLHQSAPIAEIDSLISQAQDCIADLKNWMTTNKLQLNDDKTELMFVTKSNHPDLPSAVTINDCSVSISTSVRSLGVILDQSLSFEKQVSNICKIAYLELRRISSVRHLLSTDATKTLICAFVLSRIDYCNSLLAGLPKYLIERLQRIQNHAARVVCRAGKYDHTSPLLHSLHWLSVSNRISYKISTLTFSSLFENGPSYLSDLLQIYTPSRQLRSCADDRILRQSQFRTKTGERSFSFQAPAVWNKLPYSLRHSDSISSFKAKLKTHLFLSK